ncbi:MAG: UDP-N-acetylmuramoyl-tripeptide--D-alanyl-D-alanine ligase [Coriobacteriales bacterium]|jgi:UDP-N-acetylmuramoyl-tripeptide--D-alanyl-D-alanine ligase|nr:UDP-N-acetylmuramoyl-tripeptide--D-alanyl-D-alanine ligase [Coriobacteriales bacterium]
MQLTITEITALSQALTIVPARDSQRVVRRVSWDSRILWPGALFVALPGEHLDGNNFIIEAFEKGAAVVIASRQVSEAERFAAEQHRAALLYAPDGQLALQRLASGWREQLGAKVIGITGSSGKTSTKALVSAILEKAFLTVASLGNRNNEVGLPASVLSASPTTEALIVEMAMRGSGQIEELAAIARPQVGIITNVGPVHLELLGTKENVARAKAELIEALPDGQGIAILNGDDPYTPYIREVARTAERELHVILFGLGRHNDIRAADIEYDEDGRPSFDLWLQDGSPRRVSLSLRGEHSIYNALAAAATGISLGVEPAQIVGALERAEAAPMRQVSHELDDGTLLIDDTYNANPDSMRAALEMLRRLDRSRPHIAVLGDMGELGADEVPLHEDIGKAAYANEVDVLVTIGERALHYAQGARAAGMDEAHIVSCPDVGTALEALAPLREQAPVILVKASRFMGLERVVEGLREGERPPGAVSAVEADETDADEGRDAVTASGDTGGQPAASDYDDTTTDGQEGKEAFI